MEITLGLLACLIVPCEFDYVNDTKIPQTLKSGGLVLGDFFSAIVGGDSDAKDGLVFFGDDLEG